MYAVEMPSPDEVLAERLTGETPARARRQDWLRPGSSGRSEAREAETTKRLKPWKRALAGAVVGAAVLATWAPVNAYVPGAYTQDLASPSSARASAALTWAATVPPSASWAAAARSAVTWTAAARAATAPPPTRTTTAARRPTARWAVVNAAPINGTDLAGIRGGFVLPNGMNLDFGAIIETVRNGVTLLRTQVNFINPTTAIVETLRDGVTTTTTVDASQGIETSAGSVDATFVLHQITPTNIGAIVNNVTSNTDILNTTQFNITISNFSEITNNLQAIKFNRLSNITRGSILSGLGL